MVGVALGVGAWGLVTGMAMVKGGLAVWVAVLMSLIGIALGHRVPSEWGLGFAGTVALLAMTCSMLSDRATWLPALVAGGAAVMAFALPLKLNMLVAIAAAVVVGTVIDHTRPALAKAAP